MPFNPTIIDPEPWPEDDAGELALPPELAALGEQLRIDAQRLSALYPANAILLDSTPKVHERDVVVAALLDESNRANPLGVSSPAAANGGTAALGRHWFRWLVSGTIASALLLVSLAPVARWLSRPLEQPPRLTETRAATGVLDSSLAHDDQPLRIPSRQSPSSASDSRAEIQASPVLFLQDASGPELEGLLDLMEHDASQQAPVSI